LYEKTPFYWFEYFYKNYYEKSDEKVPHPSMELARKLHSLKKVEKELLRLIGLGNITMAAYNKGKTYKSPTELLRAVHLNQRLIQKVLLVAEEQYENADDAKELEEFTKFMEEEVVSDSKVDPEEVFKTLEDNVRNLQLLENELHYLIKKYGRPNYLQANWMKYTGMFVGTYVALRWLVGNANQIVSWIKDARIATKNFWSRYLEEPLLNIYKTIRYERSSFVVMDKSAVDADVDSLVRMVGDYVKQKEGEKVSPQLILEAQNGDLKSIMPAYEKSIQEPIRSTIFGDLIQLILIQVQNKEWI